MPTKINDNFNIQTWKKLLVSFKMYTWFTEKKHTKQTKKLKEKKYKKPQNIYVSRIKNRIFVE